MKLLQTNLYDPEPKKEDFEVFDHLPHGGAYKKLEGRRKYNDEMYQEAHSQWKRRKIKPIPTDYKLKNESMQDWFGSDRCETYKKDLQYYEQHRLKYEGFEYKKQDELTELIHPSGLVILLPEGDEWLLTTCRKKGFNLVFDKGLSQTLFNQICKENGIKIKEI
jgi:arsenate reductase-like glutaredoxin family protein